MGTTAEITAIGLSPATIRSCAALLEELEGRWSRFRPNSEISQLNRLAGERAVANTEPVPVPVPVIVSGDTFDLLAVALDACRQTGGLFDPTIGTSMLAAGYDRSFELLADAAAADLAATDAEPTAGHRASPGAAAIQLDDMINGVLMAPGTAVDLGGIAKGAAADLLAQRLMDAGAEGCCVNLGGDLRAMGVPPRSEGWQVRIDAPGAEQTIDIGLAEGAVCTSSKAKRRWRPARPGSRLGSGSGSSRGAEHHLRHPATGAPLETGVTSVTVVAARATQAEVLCKVAFAAGIEQGPDLVTARGATGVMVEDDGTVVTLQGFDTYRAASLVPVGIG